MKTVEEAAKESGLVNRMAKTNIEEAFINGVEFAQRWIPVDEELPKVGDSIIARLFYDGWIHDAFDNITQKQIDSIKSRNMLWRPIEYK